MAATRIDLSPCPVPPWLPDRHSQTIYASTFAQYHRIAFVRERVDTPDTDFVDFDWTGPGLFPHKAADGSPIDAITPQSGIKTAAARWMKPADWGSLPRTADTPALLLFHGLEGGSTSRYAQSIAHHFRARGWIVAVAHFRGCSGTPNRLARAYYSGDSAEVGFMLATARARIPHARWHAVGVSLGGNALLKYLGEHAEETSWLAGAAGVSVPLDLVAGGKALCTGLIARRIYTPYFLRTMRRKVLEKAKRFPGAIDVMRIAHARDLRDFDDAYTAPMHGYRNALDYWTRASSKPWLPSIKVPTLVLNARNDPFLPEDALPTPAECSASVLLHQPSDGGHAGFPTGPFPGHLNWLPQRLGRFFETGK
ncbi:alpha/beta hydrolase [Bordetella genomosp. 1]|uniref:Alpha/beta hydrolase n=1 Tax=Bordetella genomosp. 1 TaxID=1395607 RepID=A0A261SPM7_9BORD|nr:alpha/beta fold hydrolase [Bordetella genomosp. 1]MDQ8035010.1 alpha/beta fold hydrolase [Bordetella sp.]OZI38967.1 alpha/beta hydrolase [Bordetella genomosp. 1]